MTPPAQAVDEPHAAAGPTNGLTMLMFASFLALTTVWTGVAGTVWFAIQSEQSGVTAALMSGCWIGFGAGALIGSLVSHWGFENHTTHPLLRVVIPMVGASVGFAVFGLTTVGVIRMLVLTS